MKIYLAGPMRNIPSFNFPAFHHAAAILRAQGHEVFSPAEHDIKKNGPGIADNPTGDETLATQKDGFSIRAALEADTQYICRHADAVALLPGWNKSKGAIAEAALAEAIGIQIIELGDEYVA